MTTECVAAALDGEYVSPCRRKTAPGLPYSNTQAALVLKNVNIKTSTGVGPQLADRWSRSATLSTRFYVDECRTPAFVLETRDVASPASSVDEIWGPGALQLQSLFSPAGARSQ